MPNPFLTAPSQKKRQAHDESQSQGNPFMSATHATHATPAAPKRNCFSELTPPSESGIGLAPVASVSAVAPVPLTFEESFPSLSKTPASTATASTAPLNFKLAIQANIQRQPEQQQQLRQPEQQQQLRQPEQQQPQQSLQQL